MKKMMNINLKWPDFMTWSIMILFPAFILAMVFLSIF